MILERSAVQWGKTSIPYAIKRTSRRKTVALTIEPAGKLIVSAPAGVATSKLDNVVHAKAHWVVTRLRQVQKLDAPTPKEFVSGETFLYLGRQYRLKVLKSAESGTATMERGFLHVPVDLSLNGQDRAEQVRAAVIRWYSEHALERLQERVEWWSAKLEVSIPQVLIREQAKRWGSCSPGVVRFNWRIIQAPMRLLDYVVAHELVHLLHPDHGKAFWSRLGRIMHDYQPRRTALSNIGSNFIW